MSSSATSGRRYLRRLAALDPHGSLLAPADVRMLLLTGQSSFRSARLAAEQVAFLRAVSPCPDAVVEAGFPFHADLLADEREPFDLLVASARNARQVVWSMTSSRYQQVVQRTLQQALNATRERLMVVTGSCGLQLLNRAWTSLVVPPRLRVQVVALGPACFAPLRLRPAEVTVIAGTRDPWSRLFYYGRADLRVACGHLDYWASPEVRARVAAILR